MTAFACRMTARGSLMTARGGRTGQAGDPGDN
jgi:hypothetical protein